MRIDDLNWMDIENYLIKDDRLILVFGACEQHGYLSVLTDVRIPMALADAASKQTGVIIAPPLNFGCSPYFVSYPGTLSLRSTTFLDAAEDILRSAWRQGFKRFLVLNGHGGNNGLKIRLDEIANDIPEMKIQWYAWWTAHSVEEISLRHNIKPKHANWLEAFPFTVVSELPVGEKLPPRVPSEIMNSDIARQTYGDGSFGGAYRVDKEIMQEIFNAALEDILHLLKFEY
jgi:creatinine amidohydrolase